MADLTITKVRVLCRDAGNKMPTSGDATFSDGKVFDWSLHARDKVFIFYGNRRMPHGGWEGFSFRSPKRAALLDKAIEEGHVEDRVITVL